jgi:hypothetical protein
MLTRKLVALFVLSLLWGSSVPILSSLVEIERLKLAKQVDKVRVRGSTSGFFSLMDGGLTSSKSSERCFVCL